MENLDLISIGSDHSRINVVKITFKENYISRNTNKKSIRLYIWIGSEIACKLKWKNGDFINVHKFNDYLLLNKIDETDQVDSEYKTPKGYIFKKIDKSYSYGISFTCNFMTDAVEKGIRTVKYEIVDTNSENLTLFGVDEHRMPVVEQITIVNKKGLKVFLSEKEI